MKSQNTPKSLYEFQLQTIIKWFRVSLKLDLKVPKHVKLYDKLWIFFSEFSLGQISDLYFQLHFDHRNPIWPDGYGLIMINDSVPIIFNFVFSSWLFFMNEYKNEKY